MRTYHSDRHTPQPVTGQADKSHIRYLEHRKRALLRELDKVNSELRSRSSARRQRRDVEVCCA